MTPPPLKDSGIFLGGYLAGATAPWDSSFRRSRALASGTRHCRALSPLAVASREIHPLLPYLFKELARSAKALLRTAPRRVAGR